MIAPSDPKGINKAGSPGDIDHTISAWGYVHGRQERRRLWLGGMLFLAAGLAILAAFFLYRFGGSNTHKTSRDLYRSSELSGPELKRHIRQHGIKTVIRLVGTEGSNRDSFDAEQAAIADTGATLVVAKLPTSRMPWRSELSRLFEVLDAAERPIHVHCEAGSDRSGLVSTIWLHDYEGKSMPEAREQLAFFPYGHVEFGAARELGRFLDLYEAFAKTHPEISIKHWVRDHYFEEKPGREVAWYE